MDKFNGYKFWGSVEREPCPIIYIYGKISCLEVVFHFFLSSVAMVNTFLKIGLYQRRHHDLQICQVSRNYLSYFQSYGHFSAIFCIYVTFLVPYLHIKALQWICPESSRIVDLKKSISRKLLNQFWPNKLH